MLNTEEQTFNEQDAALCNTENTTSY